MTTTAAEAAHAAEGWSPRSADSPAQRLDRPLTSYYLLVGSSGLLLTLGLVMVLSASSVWSYEVTAATATTFLKQLTWVFLAVPFVWAAVRLPHRVLRLFAWPALLVSVVLLYLTQTAMGVTVNGNRNWLALGPVRSSPPSSRSCRSSSGARTSTPPRSGSSPTGGTRWSPWSP